MEYRSEYKRTIDSTWILDSAALTAGQFPRTISGLTPGTQYDARCRATDTSGNVGSYSATSQATTLAASGGSVVVGSFHYNPNGNDANNGILVGETGSGTTLNGTAGTGARKTVGQFQTDVATGSGRYRVGDRIYIHPPGFVFTTGFVIRSASSTLDLVNKLNIEGLPGFRDSVIWDTATNLVPSFGGGGMGPIHSLNCNIRISNLTLHACDTGFSTGNQNGSGDVPAHGNVWENLRVQQTGPALAGSGGNGGHWKCQHANAADFIIRGCYAEATAHNSTNIGIAYQIHVPRFKIEYNYFHDLSGVGPLIHEKRDDQGVVTIGDKLVHGNILHATTAGRACCHGNIARWRFTNNLFIRENPSAGRMADARSDPGGSTYTDGYQQDYSHNTWVGIGSRGTAGPNANVGGGGGCLVAGQAPGGLLLMRNDLFDNAFPGFDNVRAENDHQSNVNYLMLNPTIAAQEWSTQYNQSGWAGLSGAALARMASSTHDVNSVYGTPIYAVGTQDPTDATTYRLHSTSPGYQDASDGTDMGINADDCGPQALGYVF